MFENTKQKAAASPYWVRSTQRFLSAVGMSIIVVSTPTMSWAAKGDPIAWSDQPVPSPMLNGDASLPSELPEPTSSSWTTEQKWLAFMAGLATLAVLAHSTSDDTEDASTSEAEAAQDLLLERRKEAEEAQASDPEPAPYTAPIGGEGGLYGSEHCVGSC